jgi:hypothetical protein
MKAKLFHFVTGAVFLILLALELGQFHNTQEEAFIAALLFGGLMSSVIAFTYTPFVKKGKTTASEPKAAVSWADALQKEGVRRRVRRVVALWGDLDSMEFARAYYRLVVEESNRRRRFF